MGTEGSDRAVTRLRDEKDLLAALKDAQQQLEHCQKEKAMLQAR